MKQIYFILAVGASFFANAQNEFPTNPEPGKCYVKCVTQDEFRTETEQVKVKPEFTVLEIVPATFKTVTEQVLVKEASKKMVYHPAVYKTVEVPYEVKQKETVLNIIEAQFGSDSQTFEVFPKTTKWEYTDYADCKSPNPNDCRVLCLTEAPAQFETVTLTTLVRDAQTTELVKENMMSSYKKQVVDKPAYVEEIDIPAEYATIERSVVDTPARTVEKTIPAEFATVEKTVLAKKGGVESWAEIDCGLVKGQDLDILWDTNSAVLRPDAKREVDNVLLPLMQNQGVSIELSSHTDSRGSDQFNMALSQRRADAVKSYLVSKGISPNRIVSKGYGETRLRNNCGNGVNCTAAQHQVNRRTEYRVIQNNN